MKLYTMSQDSQKTFLSEIKLKNKQSEQSEHPFHLTKCIWENGMFFEFQDFKKNELEFV